MSVQLRETKKVRVSMEQWERRVIDLLRDTMNADMIIEITNKEISELVDGDKSMVNKAINNLIKKGKLIMLQRGGAHKSTVYKVTFVPESMETLANIAITKSEGVAEVLYTPKTLQPQIEAQTKVQNEIQPSSEVANFDSVVGGFTNAWDELRKYILQLEETVSTLEQNAVAKDIRIEEQNNRISELLTEVQVTNTHKEENKYLKTMLSTCSDITTNMRKVTKGVKILNEVPKTFIVDNQGFINAK